MMLANAPVSYGVFGMEPGEGVRLPGGEMIASWVAEAGYSGVDSGPLELFGGRDRIVETLRTHGLGLAGGWVDLPFASDTETFRAELPRLRGALEVFAVAAEGLDGLAPKPTLACSGSAERRGRPGGAPELTLTGAAWERYAAHVQQAVDIVRKVGLEPTFHHHACTYVETPLEVDALLASTDVGLTFDTGHLLIGGGDPERDLARWASRINHVHLKDVRREVLADALLAADPMAAVWSAPAFVPLGKGDLDIPGVMAALFRIEYDEWLVVEQDVVPASQASLAAARVDQACNREVLRTWFP